MSTDQENWRDNVDENQQSNREQRSYNRESKYNRYGDSRGERPSYRRDEGNSYRPSSNYGERGSYNRNNGDRQQRPRISRPYNANGNSERPSYNREDGEHRAFRPRVNREGGERNFNSYNRSERPQRSYNNFNSYNNDERPQRSYNNYNNDERPRFRRNNNQEVDGNRYGGYSEGNESRPRFRSYDNNNRRPQQGGFRPRRNNDGYNPNNKYTKKKQFQYREQLVDPDEPIRLNKYLANAGVCSRREADEFITAGVVAVNGVVVTELGTKVKRGDNITFHNEPVAMERKVYVLLNKPKDCVTTSDDPQERKTVMDFVQGACKERIYPVGRLDRNTTGVLLLTNDGDLASKLTHPKYLKKKIYHVHCDKNVTKADMDQIAAGITLEDGEIHADEISYISESKSEVGIEIHSGKNRIVRRIFESLGYRVVKLDRVFFAGLTKKNLRRGQWRYLTDKEVNMLRMGAFE